MIKPDEMIAQIKWDANGLVTCIAQDVHDHTVLMVAYMNQESLKITLEKGRICYYSRSRKKLWLKGEESGNVQILKNLYIDCDGDCLLARVEQIGKAACHTGMRTCFYTKLEQDGKLMSAGEKIFDPEKVYKRK